LLPVIIQTNPFLSSSFPCAHSQHRSLRSPEEKRERAYLLFKHARKAAGTHGVAAAAAAAAAAAENVIPRVYVKTDNYAAGWNTVRRLK